MPYTHTAVIIAVILLSALVAGAAYSASAFIEVASEQRLTNVEQQNVEAWTLVATNPLE